jgi:hypothetical protein
MLDRINVSLKVVWEKIKTVEENSTKNHLKLKREKYMKRNEQDLNYLKENIEQHNVHYSELMGKNMKGHFTK